jgi:hypothetical protein
MIINRVGAAVALCFWLIASTSALGQRSGATRVVRVQSDTTHLTRVTVAGPIRIRPWSPEQTMSSPASRGLAIDTMGTVQSIAATVVKDAPFSAQGTTEYRMSLSDGTHIVRASHFTIYRDRYGRLRREDSATVWIADPVAKVAYILDPKTGVAQRLPLRELVDSSPGFAGTQEARTDSPLSATPKRRGQQMIDGLSATCGHTEKSIPAGAIGNDRAIVVVSERCWSRRLKLLLSSQVHDPVQGDVAFRLSAIRTVDPEPRLFSVPAGYRVETVK